MVSAIMKFSLSSSLILSSRGGRTRDAICRHSPDVRLDSALRIFDDGSSTNPAEILKILKILETSNSSSAPLLNLGVWYIDLLLHLRLTSTTAALNALSCTIPSACSALGSPILPPWTPWTPW
jgi:hypothetical protein